jgi:hypothetical protein
MKGPTASRSGENGEARRLPLSETRRVATAATGFTHDPEPTVAAVTLDRGPTKVPHRLRP